MRGGGFSGDFVFAQPRLQARHAALLRADAWMGLEQVADYGHFLQQLRSTALASVAEGFGAGSPIDVMEIALRKAFAERVEEMASWLPESWRPAVLWVRALPMAPLLHHARGEGPLSWMKDDAELAAQIAREDEETQSAAVDPAQDWLTRWHALWPHDVAGLIVIGENIVEAALPLRVGNAPWPERRARLAAWFKRAFRDHAFGPGAAFAQLGLLLLEFTRVQGNLSARKAQLIG